MLNVTVQASLHDEDDDEEEEADSHEESIRWINIIFLPFHPCFEFIVMICVLLKCTLGPLQTVLPFVECSEVMDHHAVLSFLKYFYLYGVDVIYAIDTFLHIMHRQVTDEAMRREHLPKSAFYLLLDLISLVPLIKLTANDLCPVKQFWPNVLGNNQFLIIYRVQEYFALKKTHSTWRVLSGFALMYLLIFNFTTCFFLLLTYQGLCEECVMTEQVYDWRLLFINRFKTAKDDFITYIFSLSMVTSYILHKLIDSVRPYTYSEMFICSIFMTVGYMAYIFIILPKIFAEAMLKLRHAYLFHLFACRVINETEMRNPTSSGHTEVEKFYSLLWEKRRGINTMPKVINELPRYLKMDIRLDLVWPVYHHSPTLRQTSPGFKRWLCSRIHLEYRMPGERFYAGPHCYTNMYYLKKGVLQLISADDSTSALLSVTGGTIFGDISFFCPPLNRKVIVHCLSYCEVFTISRAHILQCLHKFPDDRLKILHLAKTRIAHARKLFACKNVVRGQYRSEDEGIAWIKKRWWGISRAVKHSYLSTSKKKGSKFELPPEETRYHCAKYIGQLVLCSDSQLKQNSMFINTNFPYVLTPRSSFGLIWHRIVVATVFVAFLVYPPNITRIHIPKWFKVFQFCVDIVYITDIFISMMTALRQHTHEIITFSAVVFARFRTLYFFLDLLSIGWIEFLMKIFQQSKLYYLCQYNRVIKTYILFVERYGVNWNRKKSPFNRAYYLVCLATFVIMYLFSYFLYILKRLVADMTYSYYFSGTCSPTHDETGQCESPHDVFVIAVGWTFEYVFAEYIPRSITDCIMGMSISFLCFFLYAYLQGFILAIEYLKNRERVNYSYFVSNIKQYYIHHKIHPNLLKRLERYLNCHWKYYHGMDILHPNILKDVPYDIYWKAHGEAAKKVLKHSRAFADADPALLKELVHKSKFLVLPQNATIFMFGIQCKNVSYIVHGSVKCEYHDDDGEIQTVIFSSGQLLSLSSVFLDRPSFRTVSAGTDCEILHIRRSDFHAILKRHPDEKMYFDNCEKEFAPIFDSIFEEYYNKHKDYQMNLRSRIFHANFKQSTQSFLEKKPSKRKLHLQEAGERLEEIPENALQSDEVPKLEKAEQEDVDDEITKDVEQSKIYKLSLKILAIYRNYRIEPESKFMMFWMPIRAVTVIISIVSISVQGGIGATIRWQLGVISIVCDVISAVDIVIKCLLPYYDSRGLVISDVKKCVLHYFTRGFAVDIIATLPWHYCLEYILNTQATQSQKLLFTNACKFAQVYLLTGYFNYLADKPSVSSIFYKIAKYQIVVVLMMLSASHYFFSRCIELTWDDDLNIISMEKVDKCWMPYYVKFDKKPTLSQMHFLYVESMNLAQCALTRHTLGFFHVNRENIVFGIFFIILGLIFRYLFCYCQTLLILHFRGNTLYQHGVYQLEKFLTSERVEKQLIARSVAHFSYTWARTKGLNIQDLMGERISVVFRQDLNYYFYKKTFVALDTVLLAGENILREIASFVKQNFFLPSEEILREMDLTPLLYIVHRGRVLVSKNGQKLAILTKGCVFGQLQGSKLRPVKISARAVKHADILTISLAQFQDIINDDIRRNIAKARHSQDDFLILKILVTENPYNTVKYILRGHKTIKLPWMKEPLEARNSPWYSRWLFCAWIIAPGISTILVLLTDVVPRQSLHILVKIYIFLDTMHLVNLISEFYTMRLTIVERECIYVYNRVKNLTSWMFYIDIISFLTPFLTIFTKVWEYQLARLLRLHYFYDYNKHFSMNFQFHSGYTPVFMKFGTVLLILHALTCGWITIACRGDDAFRREILVDLPPETNKTINHAEWLEPTARQGCARVMKNFDVTRDDNTTISAVNFMVPRYWYADYIVAFTFIIVIQTGTNLDLVLPLSFAQVYYKLFTTTVLYLVELWICSVTISAIYTSFRELYQYDYNVFSLIRYLKSNDLAASILESVKKFTTMLWQRQEGNWLPEITQQAPMCLRQDILGSLYMHHMLASPLFRKLPDYFLRQLVTRVTRVVIFPGKVIINEGDVYPCTYFIHQGEVEKWYTDFNGNQRMSSVLFSCGYFGVIPGLYPNIPYQFTYCTRTVVDLVSLHFSDWQDLLNGYPEVKVLLYDLASKFKIQLMSSQATHHTQTV